MISQISNSAFPREASYNTTSAPAPTTGMEAQDPTALAPATTGVPGDSFNSSATTLAPTTAPAEEQKKKGPNPWAVGAAVLGIGTAVAFGANHVFKWGWLEEAVQEGGEAAADAAKNMVQGAGDSIDNVAGKTPVADASQAVIHTSSLNIAELIKGAEAFDEKTGRFVKDVKLNLNP
jgi:hypothetical protein